MKKLLFLLHFGFLIIFLPNPAFAEMQESDAGTLIVTYKTDNKGERLNRIRFWLIDSTGSKVSLYPKNRAFVEDPKEPSRMVVIEKIKSGNYTLKFLVPNADRYFQDTIPREVRITQGNVVKLDQQIKPVSGLQSLTLLDSKREPPLDIKEKTEFSTSSTIPSGQNVPPPPIPLQKIAKISATECENGLKNCAREELSLTRPLSGQNFIGENKTSLPTSSGASPSKSGYGKLIISYDNKAKTKEGSQEIVRLRLIDSQGSISIHPIQGKDTEVQLIHGKMMVIPDIRAGNYRIEFFIEGNNRDPILSRNDIKIEAGSTKSVHEVLDNVQRETTVKTSSLQGPGLKKEEVNKLTLSVTANIPTAIFRLEHQENKHSIEGDGRIHTFENLEPGTYTLSFDSFDPFFVPPPAQTIILNSGNETIESVYQTLSKIKVVSNVKRGKVNIVHLNTFEHLTPIEIKDGVGTGYYPPGDYQAVFDAKESGKIAPDPMHLRLESLQTKEITAYFIP